MKALCFLILAAALICATARAARADVAYEVEIAGVEDDTLASALRDNSQLVKLKDRQPPSIAALRRRADDDVPRLLQLLHDSGYWTAAIEVAIDEAAQPAKVTLLTNPGPLFHLASVDFAAAGGGKLPEGLDAAAIGLTLGDPARAGPVLAAEPKIAAYFEDRGYPFAKVGDRKVVIDEGTQTMRVAYVIDQGATARFGTHHIEGLKSLDPAYVERRITWKEGEPYDGRKVAATRKALLDANLFSLVEVRHDPALAADGTVPMTLALTERLPRSIGAGIDYSTHYGIGTNIFWEHRNLFGGAESLRADATFAQAQLAAGLRFRKPDFLTTRQDLLASAELAEDSPVAYTSRRFRVFSGLERRLGDQLTLGGGLAWEHGNVTARDITQHYQLVGVPLSVRRDASDDLLNPTRGDRESVELTPYTSIDGGGLTFVSSRYLASLYQRFDEEGKYVLASFARLGIIAGESHDRVPADKRFYGGGGGSVRAYGYQLMGPVDNGDKPLGGLSSFEFGTELRIKITETIGIAPFVEAGNVYQTTVPHFAGRYFYGAGLGLRYYTAIGPLRFDVATPLSRRSFDSAFQIYVSLGQAF